MSVLPSTPEGWAIQLSKLLNITSGENYFPVNVPDLAREYSRSAFSDEPIVKVQGISLSTQIEGMLVPVPGKGWGIIYNNATTSTGRQNFTLAHEFGHYLLHRHLKPDGFQCGHKDMHARDLQSLETEANRFASLLLSCTNETWTITINSGVTINSTAAATASLVTGTWPSGSNVTLINNGNIYGKGGAGGTGGNGDTGAGGSGGAGGPAMSLGVNLTINNTNGNIFGGGGGGGGGRGCGSSGLGVRRGGGGGGGGQGSTNTAGGSGGTGNTAAGTAGTTGTASAPGSGGAGTGGGTGCSTSASPNGGDGGTWGAAGSAPTSGGTGGAAGKAINRNGFTPTFTGGNTAARVKGAVS